MGPRGGGGGFSLSFPSGASIQVTKCTDRASVPSPIDMLMDTMARDRVPMHVLVFCVNLELWEIISFTLKSNYYIHVAVSSLQYICCLTKLLLQAKNFFYR